MVEMPRQQTKTLSKKDEKYKKNNSDKSKFNSGKLKRFKYIQRNKIAEELLRKHRDIELSYREKRNWNKTYDHVSDSEENSYGQLLSTFKLTHNIKPSAIERSDGRSVIGITSENIELNKMEKIQSEVKTCIVQNGVDIVSDNSTYSDNFDDSKEKDPFSIHLNHELSSALLNSLTFKPQTITQHHIKTPALGCLEIFIPSDKINDNSIIETNINTPLILDDVQKHAELGTIPKILKSNNLKLIDNHVKIQLEKNIESANRSNFKYPTTHKLSQLQSELFSLMNNYQDIYFPNRNFNNGEEVRLTYCLHILNHVLKTRSKIIHHNSRLAKFKYQDRDAIPECFRDQGLVRPKVLIILPFRDSAYRVINILINLLVPDSEAGVINHKKFIHEFSGNSIIFPIKNPKPEDYEKTFAGNIDDTFRIGISLTKKCIKLYTEFNKSDIIISSPLGLRMIIGAPGEKDRNYDFLSSIELLVIDQAEIFIAQNWDHLLHVLNHLHLQPQTVETDCLRIRSWAINGLTKFYCQTILLTSHELPEFRALYNHRFLNYRGKIRVANPIANESVKKVLIQIPQIFHRINVLALNSSFDSRFNYFINNLLPQYKKSTLSHCLIYVPSYFDYVRIRNYMKRESINYVQICEYSKEEKIARARDLFFHSNAQFLLYSERAHFFKRIRIKGIHHLIFYQPPNWPNFYAEIVNLMREVNQDKRDLVNDPKSITVLYTKYDILQVSAIVGNEKASKMMSSDKITHMIMAGN